MFRGKTGKGSHSELTVLAQQFELVLKITLRSLGEGICIFNVTVWKERCSWQRTMPGTL